jgi:quercetin dioxygenase-like cupin family protein
MVSGSGFPAAISSVWQIRIAAGKPLPQPIAAWFKLNIAEEYIMIVKSADAKKKEFLGVSFDVLAVGEMSMVTKMNFKKGDSVPFHRHSNEQSGYVITGKLRFIFGDFDETLNPGDTYSIPANVKHSIEVIETGTVIDFFVPPRKDYL